MKKWITLLVCILSFTLLVSCKTESNAPNQTDDQVSYPLSVGSNLPITVTGFSGTGTTDDPYLVELLPGETRSALVNVSQESSALVLHVGHLQDGLFVDDPRAGSVKATFSDSSIFLTGAEVGQAFVELTDGITSVWFEVNTVVHDGSVAGVENYAESIRILAIGNSFSKDAMSLLAELFNSYGVTNVTLAYLSIGGASLELHYANTANNNNSYNYWKNNENNWVYKGKSSILTGLQDEQWDIITLQQVSSYSGIAHSYEPYLAELLDYIENNLSTSPTLMWHNTWAYAEDSTHAAFTNYNFNQQTMFDAIIKVTSEVILTKSAFRMVIPSGVAIQNLRTSTIGDNLNRDGHHLNLLGRYTAALAWFRSITGFPLENIEFKPSDVSEKQKQLAIKAVNAAYSNRLTITRIDG